MFYFVFSEIIHFLWKRVVPINGDRACLCDHASVIATPYSNIDD